MKWIYRKWPRNPLLGALLGALIASALYWATYAAVTHAKPPHVKLAPPVPCTAKMRMNIYIDEDNILYECQCQWLKTIPLCAWQVIGGVDVPAIRKRHRRARAYTIPVLVIHHV